MYVACTGDCRAVAGVWEPSSDGSGNGIWRVDVLSDDQTGRNPSELKRYVSFIVRSCYMQASIDGKNTLIFIKINMAFDNRLQAEHPRETETVVQRGRILGGLEPSMAFGDARYKWPLKVQQMYVPSCFIYNSFLVRPDRNAQLMTHGKSFEMKLNLRESN